MKFSCVYADKKSEYTRYYGTSDGCRSVRVFERMRRQECENLRLHRIRRLRRIRPECICRGESIDLKLTDRRSRVNPGDLPISRDR